MLTFTLSILVEIFKGVFADDDTGPRLQRSDLSKGRTDDDGNFTQGNKTERASQIIFSVGYTCKQPTFSCT